MAQLNNHGNGGLQERSHAGGERPPPGLAESYNDYGAVAISTRRPAPKQPSPRSGFAAYLNSGASVSGEERRMDPG